VVCVSGVTLMLVDELAGGVIGYSGSVVAANHLKLKIKCRKHKKEWRTVTCTIPCESDEFLALSATP